MPKRYTDNPFAVLGIPRDCAKPDREPAVKQRRMELKLSGEDDGAIRTALQAIDNPQVRLRHEIFWPDFGDEPGPADFALDASGKAVMLYESDAGDDVRSAHNLAILTHAQAIAAEAAEEGNAAWARALRRWHDLCERQDFWEFVGQRIVEFGDARIRIDELDTLKREVPREVLAPAGAFAASHLRAGNAARAKRLFEHVEASGFDRIAIDDTLAKACAPSIERIDAMCERWEEFLRTLDSKSKDELEKSWEKLRAELVPPARQLHKLEPLQPRGVTAARDRAAKVMRNYGVNAFNAQRTHEVTQEALALARELAASEAESKRIEKDQRDLATTKDEDKCAFCGQPAKGNRSQEVHVHRIQGEEVQSPQSMLEQFRVGMYDQPQARSVRYNTITFQVPRCPECKKIHGGGSSETHRKASTDGCGGCFLALVIPAAVLGYLHWQTGYLDAWDYASGGAVFALVMTFAVWADSRKERALQRSNRPTTRPWSEWTEWPQAADILARGYLPGKEPTQEQVTTYLNGNHSTYQPDSGPRTCRSCGHKTKGPADNCPHCGGDRMAAKSIVTDAEEEEAKKKAAKGSPIAAAFWLLLVLAIVAITLRPTRREIMWRIAEHRNTTASYLSFARQFPTGKYSDKANAVVDAADWDEATKSDGYWDYLVRQPRGKNVTEAMRRLHAKRPWKGKQLVHAIEVARREIGANVVIEEFLWERVQEEDTTEAYLAYARTHKSYERRESAMTREAERRADERTWEQAKKTDTLAGYRSYLSKFRKGVHAADAKQAVKDAPWFAAKKRDTITAYRTYLRKNPRSKHAAAARDRIDDIEWAIAAKSRRLSSIESYLRRYPRGRHRADATDLLDSMFWESATKNPSIQRYTHYLKRVPRGRHVDEAKRRIDDLMWDSARAKNTVEAYRNYLKLSPLRTHGDEAKAFIRDAPWFAVAGYDTEPVYRQFIGKYPNSPRVADAKRRIQTLRWERALAKHTEAEYTSFLRTYAANPHVAEAKRIRDALQKRSDPIKSGTSAFLVGPKVKTGIDMRELKTRNGSRRLPLRLAVTRTVTVLPAVKTRLTKREAVVGIVVGGCVRAYRVNALASHHVINDVLGGVPIAVMYDRLSGAIGAFDRRVGDRVLFFAPTKHVYRNAAVYYDTETETFWNPVRGEAIVGPLTGQTLAWVSSELTTWDRWRTSHPFTQSANARYPAANYRHSSRYEQWKANKPPYATGPHPVDKTWRPTTLVWVTRTGDKLRCYPNTPQGETKDGEYTLTRTGGRLEITRNGQPVPSMRMYWASWSTHVPDGTVFK